MGLYVFQYVVDFWWIRNSSSVLWTYLGFGMLFSCGGVGCRKFVDGWSWWEFSRCVSGFGTYNLLLFLFLYLFWLVKWSWTILLLDYSTLCLISVHSLGKICGWNEIRNVVRVIRYKVKGGWQLLTWCSCSFRECSFEFWNDCK